MPKRKKVNKIRIEEFSGYLDGELEGLKILHNIEKSLNPEEKIFFFTFFDNNSPNTLSYSKLMSDNIFSKNRRFLRKIIGIWVKDSDFNRVNKKILEIWNKYTKKNGGKFGNCLGTITLHLVKNYLENLGKYEKIFREAKIFLNYIELTPKVDLVCNKEIIYDLCACKKNPLKRDAKIIEDIEDLCKISKKLKTHNYENCCLLGTTRLVKKTKIKSEINNILNEDKIINGEDIFRVTIV